MNRKLKVDIARKPVTFTQCDIRRSIFAPSWDLLMGYKSGELDWPTYTQRYIEEMRQAYKTHKGEFVNLARKLPDLELVCWCCNSKEKTRKKECHRFLLIDILKKVRALLNV